MNRRATPHAGLRRMPARFFAANRALGWYGEQKTWPEILKFYKKNYPNLQMLNTSGQTQTPKAYFKWVCCDLVDCRIGLGISRINHQLVL